MKKYYINEKQYSETEFYNELENAANSNATNSYDDMLDDGEEIKIGNLTYSPSQVLKAVDPIAYNVGVSDWQSNVLEDLKYDLDKYGEVEIDDKLFEIIEE